MGRSRDVIASKKCQRAKILVGRARVSQPPLRGES